MARTIHEQQHLQMALFSISSVDVINYEPPPAYPPPLPDELVESVAFQETPAKEALMRIKELITVFEIMLGEWRKKTAIYLKDARSIPHKAITASGIFIVSAGIPGLVIHPGLGVVLILAGALQLGLSYILKPKGFY